MGGEQGLVGELGICSARSYMSIHALFSEPEISIVLEGKSWLLKTDFAVILNHKNQSIDQSFIIILNIFQLNNVWRYDQFEPVIMINQKILVN